MVSFIDKLNPEQKAAVTLPAESALILAGAGSGKTRVLTTRIAWLIEQNMARTAFTPAFLIFMGVKAVLAIRHVIGVICFFCPC